MRAGVNFAGYTLYNFDSGALQCLNFFRIVGKQPNPRYSERLEYLSWECEVALVSLEPQPFIGFYSVEPRILQFISLQLGQQPDAAPFLLFVNQNSGSLVANHAERHLELLAAVATQGMKNVASQALGVHPHQRRRGAYISHHQCHCLLDAAISIRSGFGPEAVNAELAPARREVRRSNLLNLRRSHHPIIAGRLSRHAESEPGSASLRWRRAA